MADGIHPTAVIGPGASLGESCTVGPYAVIEDGAALGPRNEIGPHCVLHGSVRMGADNRLMRGASLGGEPQSLGYKGEPTLCEIGAGNWFGENAVVHRGTAETGKTVLGDHNYLMSNSHIGHDGRVGNYVILAQNAICGGHVTLRDRVNVGAAAGVHQNTRIGELAMVAGLARVVQDVLPFVILGDEGALAGLNRVGIRRSDYPREQLPALQTAYRRFCQGREPRGAMLEWLAAQPANAFLDAWQAFLSVPGRKGYARARRVRGGFGGPGSAVNAEEC